MITCVLRYELNPLAIAEFEHYVTWWMRLIRKFGGTHHGVFMPSEGKSDIALALFSFPSLAEYEKYREASKHDAECLAAMDYYANTRCFSRYEREFMRPLFLDDGPAAD